MFQTPEALSPDKHLALKLSSAPDYRFAAKEIVCPVVSGEMWQVAREYILVFPKTNEGLPLALMGTQAGVNAYLGDGNPPWWGRYIPAHFRRYPFVAAPKPSTSAEENQGNTQHFTLCIDSTAPQLSEVNGQPLFNADGSATDLLENVQKALISLQRDFGITQGLVKQIDDAGLLVDQTLTITPHNREPVGLQGFRVVDQEKLRNASPEALASLMKTRALDLIYAHLGSLSNLQDGLLAKKAEGQISDGSFAGDVDIDKLFTTPDDTLKFNF
jgi:hypothetical protein